ncbi:MAG: MotA/TolQ/ExbB proton channel family protein [bacterium]|nr:MotA/TolQ/ExbB proton channel family protein [bacterium]
MIVNEPTSSPQASMESLFDLLVAGGPMMIPIGICSIVALAYATERWLRLRPSLLGPATFGRNVLSTAQDKGPKSALELCESKRFPVARILAAGLRKAEAPFLDREKVVEDRAASEVRALGANLRPLFLVWLIAPLLGLLGTVWGMIEAFSNIALEDGLGRPEMLASGIYKALTTTAAGLAVAIPAMVAHFYLKGRIERFVRRSEDLYRELDDTLQSSQGSPTA